MVNYLKLIVFPSKTLDKLNDKKPEFITLYLIWAFATLGLYLPEQLGSILSNPKGTEVKILSLILVPFFYYPVVHGLGYFYWIVAKGFKGVSSLVEMRNLVVYSGLPFILQFIISIPFITVGLIKQDAGVITHFNYFTYLMLWLLSFRILMVGIAKYNKFNWTITIITWMITSSALGGLAYLIQLLR